MEAQREREIEQKLMAKYEEQSRRKWHIAFEIIKAFVAPVITAALTYWLTKG